MFWLLITLIAASLDSSLRNLEELHDGDHRRALTLFFAEKGLVIVRIDERIDGPTYCEMLENCFFDSAEVVLPPSFLFQQDNVSAHVYRHTTAFLENREIPVFPLSISRSERINSTFNKV